MSLPVSSTQQAIPDYTKLKKAYDLHQGCILTEELTLSLSTIMRMSLFFLQFFSHHEIESEPDNTEIDR